MKRMPAVALSIFLAPPLALTLTVAAFSAAPDTKPGTVPGAAPCCVSQPGRLETAREIKDLADAFVIKGRNLSHRVQAQIVEAEKLRIEALKLQAMANRLSDQEILLAQASTTENKPSAGGSTAVGENKTGDSKTTGVTQTPAATGSDSKAAGVAASGDPKPAGEVKPAGETASDAKPAEADKVKDEKLTGRASQLDTLPQPNIPLIKLRGPQLQQAMKQFNDDVEQFKIHAADYAKHYNLFKSQVGECHAARSSFDQLHKKYEMHCTTYHLNNIPPPKLCPPMSGSVSEARTIANQLMNDQMRALRAEGQLRQEEGRLKELEGMQGTADNLVVKASERARREKEIAGMFGRLRQEYDLLEIERKTIDHSRGISGKPSAPVVRPYVSGTVKKAK